MVWTVFIRSECGLGYCVNGLARSVTYSIILRVFQTTIKSPRRSLLVGVNLVVYVTIERTVCLIHVLEVLASHLDLGI